jgi:hypothetical protein
VADGARQGLPAEPTIDSKPQAPFDHGCHDNFVAGVPGAAQNICSPVTESLAIFIQS